MNSIIGSSFPQLLTGTRRFWNFWAHFGHTRFFGDRSINSALAKNPLTIMGFNPIIENMNKRSESATLVLHEKIALNSGLMSERKIWKVANKTKYPLNFKYRLVLVNPQTHEVILLYDNHYPKGPHVHWDEKERAYTFESIEKLISDFIQESEVEEVRYHENKNNRN